jgi:hypothetical protein
LDLARAAASRQSKVLRTFTSVQRAFAKELEYCTVTLETPCCKERLRARMTFANPASLLRNKRTAFWR